MAAGCQPVFSDVRRGHGGSGARGADASVLIAALGFSPGARDAFADQLKMCKKASAPAAPKANENGGPPQLPPKPASPADALKEKGNAAFKKGRYDEAVRQYTNAIKKEPKTSVLYSNRAMAQLKLGDFKAAEEDCTLALALDPRNVKALLRRGTARSFEQVYDEALSDYQAVLRLEPNNRDARAEVARMRKLLSPEA